MLNFEHTEVFNFEGAIRGMRNPMDAWGNIDTEFGVIPENMVEGALQQGYEIVSISPKMLLPNYKFMIKLGQNDLKRMRNLVQGGSEHRKFMRQISVCVDITAPRYWWSEFDTYKIGTTANSCSTMHRIMAYPFTADMFEIELGNMLDVDRIYIENKIKYLESLRLRYMQETDKDKKMQIFRRLKQELSEGFRQKRTITMNYENIYNQRMQRYNHRLSEWHRDYINWTDTLPCINQIMFTE